MKKKPIKLALSGSGTVLYYHIGALKRILEEYEIESAVASSGGTFPLAFLAAGKSIKDIEKMALNLKLSDFADYSWNPFDRIGLLNGDNLLKFLQKELPIKLNQTKFPLVITTTNVTQNRTVYWISSDLPISLVIRASMSIPFLFKYVVINDEIHVDGGVTNNFPIDYFNADNVIGISIKGSSQKFKLSGNLITQGLVYGFRIIQLMMDAVEKKHLEDAQYAKTIIIESKYSGYDFSHDKIAIQTMINEGYKAVDSYLSAKK
jgi:NTE family protein